MSGQREQRDRLLRIHQVLEVIPVSKSQFWSKVASGEWPQPVRHLGPRTTAWLESQIMELARGEWKAGGS